MGRRRVSRCPRQMITEDAEDDERWQLHLMIRFHPDRELDALGAGDRWCRHRVPWRCPGAAFLVDIVLASHHCIDRYVCPRLS